MRFASLVHDGQLSCGVVEGDHILVGPTSPHPDLKTVLERGTLADFAKTCTDTGRRVPVEGATLLPVIPNPGKILCVGHNYEEHRQETGRAKTAYPSLFVRFADTLIGHGAAIVRPPFSTSLDFEGELALIVGRSGFRVPPERALELVAGFSCFNDASVRDWQWHTQQFTPGKNFPSTGAFGPVLVTTDEVEALDDLKIETRLNGDAVQSSTLGHMIFSVADIIAYVTSFTRLSPGDVIATGTPGGVGAKRQPPLWLKPGDVVEVEISEIGVLRNGVADE